MRLIDVDDGDDIVDIYSKIRREKTSILHIFIHFPQFDITYDSQHKQTNLTYKCVSE